MLILSKVRKKFGRQLILDVPSFSLEPGVYWVRGANGSGKTTLLKMIAGLLPFEGDIHIGDSSLKTDAVGYRRRVAWAEAEPLYPDFVSGYDLLQLYCSIRCVDPRDADGLVDLLGMQEYIGNSAGTYSAGMTKKLSLCLAFLGKPALILLDEPLITLDSAALRAVCDLIRQRHRDDGTSFLMSSHQEPEGGLLFSGRQLQVENHTLTLSHVTAG